MTRVFIDAIVSMGVNAQMKCSKALKYANMPINIPVQSRQDESLMGTPRYFRASSATRT